MKNQKVKEIMDTLGMGVLAGPQRIVKRNPYFFTLQKSDIESPSGLSLTVPDQSYTIRELYEKFTYGIDLGVDRDVVWGEDEIDHDDVDLGQVPLLDQSERHEMLQAIKEKNQRQLDLLKASQKGAKRADEPVEGVDKTDDKSEGLSQRKTEQKKEVKKTTEKTDVSEA